LKFDGLFQVVAAFDGGRQPLRPRPEHGSTVSEKIEKAKTQNSPKLIIVFIVCIAQK
jgi:hypothetical protein